MSQTTEQQVATPPKPKVRKDWELFWRIVAGLMLVVIAWVVWVLYQITPRSVVTPLAYASQTKPIGTQVPAAAAAIAPEGAVPATPQLAPESTAADRAMALAQEAARSGAHQASADVQAATLESKAEPEKAAPVKGEGLRLATEISIPPADKDSMTQEGKPEGASAAQAATGAAGKERP